MATWLDGVDAFGRGSEAGGRRALPEMVRGEGRVRETRLAGVKGPRPRVAHIVRSGDRSSPTARNRVSRSTPRRLRGGTLRPRHRRRAGIRPQPRGTDEVRPRLDRCSRRSPTPRSRSRFDLSEPFWKSMRAVRENHVLRVPVDDSTNFLTGWYFNYAAPLGLLFTAKALHPDRFATSTWTPRRPFLPRFLRRRPVETPFAGRPEGEVTGSCCTAWRPGSSSRPSASPPARRRSPCRSGSAIRIGVRAAFGHLVAPDTPGADPREGYIVRSVRLPAPCSPRRQAPPSPAARRHAGAVSQPARQPVRDRLVARRVARRGARHRLRRRVGRRRRVARLRLRPGRRPRLLAPLGLRPRHDPPPPRRDRDRSAAQSAIGLLQYFADPEHQLPRSLSGS